ncbi:hypothetical protein GF377_03225 [candidate division GN15 bacterium]|nr:hypothetical protein [candidate division GN15 bacterium]
MMVVPTSKSHGDRSRLTLVALLPLLLLPMFAYSAEVPGGGKYNVGARLGYDTEQEQFVFGAQSELGGIIEPFDIAPSVDVGVGSDLTTYAINGDVRLDLFSPPGSVAEVYAGAGPTVLVWRPDGGPNDTEIGVTASLGLKLRLGPGSRWNVETRFGFGDVPEVRLLAGVLF